MTPPRGYADLADLPEDDRIAQIVHAVMVHRQKVAVAVDADPPDKVTRYMTKLRARCPGAQVVNAGHLTPDVIIVQVIPVPLPPLPTQAQ